MALEVKIPDEINDYEGKLILGLSVRQLLAILGAICVGLIIVFGGKEHISRDILPWLVLISAVPFFGWGFYRYDGMKFEDAVRVFVNYLFFNPKRVYEDTENNIFIKINENLLEEEIIYQLIETGQFGDDDTEEELYYG
jgi:hypothetical protein